MNQWDEEALREINSLEAARLAIRGALATIRDLQDVNAGAKAEVQDEAAKRKATEAKVAELSEQVDRWHKQAESWDKERQERTQSEARWREAVRLEVRAEERARIEESRALMETELARLHAELQQMARAYREKCEAQAKALERLRKSLDAREVELLAARRAKEEIARTAQHDWQMLEQLRQQRDREIDASIKRRELEIADKDREISALREQVQELKKVAELSAREGESRLLRAEETLRREYQARESRLAEQSAKREADLQAHWSELENGLWARTKAARERLDRTIDGQFEEKARALADRTQELEAQLAARRQELEAEFQRKGSEAEARYADAEKRLLQSWADKEGRFLKKFDEELSREKEARQRQAESLDRLKADYERALAEKDSQLRKAAPSDPGAPSS
ncbi:MAG: hypothetical protein NTY77_04600 [Elusimicrobia bacterium]|nr:hypothetical protein [Elusimicrobiota bacterium]